MYIFGYSITYNSVLNKTWLPADFNDALFVFLHVLHELCYMYLVTNLKKKKTNVCEDLRVPSIQYKVYVVWSSDFEKWQNSVVFKFIPNFQGQIENKMVLEDSTIAFKIGILAEKEKKNRIIHSQKRKGKKIVYFLNVASTHF